MPQPICVVIACVTGGFLCGTVCSQACGIVIQKLIFMRRSWASANIEIVSYLADSALYWCYGQRASNNTTHASCNLLFMNIYEKGEDFLVYPQPIKANHFHVIL